MGIYLNPNNIAFKQALNSEIYIDKSLMNVDEKDMLEDLLIVAFNDLMKKITEAHDSSMSDATGGIDLKNIKLPF